MDESCNPQSREGLEQLCQCSTILKYARVCFQVFYLREGEILTILTGHIMRCSEVNTTQYKRYVINSIFAVTSLVCIVVQKSHWKLQNSLDCSDYLKMLCSQTFSYGYHHFCPGLFKCHHFFPIIKIILSFSFFFLWPVWVFLWLTDSYQ